MPVSASRERAEALAGRLPPLLVAAERVASTVAQGLHGRRRTGQGDSFWQFRPYLPGDPVSRIDWRETAKGDRPFIRENEWDAAQSVWLWCDRSPSMDYASHRKLMPKRDRAALLTLALAALLIRGGERVAGLDGDGRPGSGRPALTRLAHLVDEAVAVSGVPSRSLPRHAELVLIGDFLDPVAETRAAIAAYLAQGVRGHLVQVLDPAEEALPFSGRIRFEGFEGEAPVLVPRADALRERYAQAMTAHRDELIETVRAAGWSFALHHTDRPAEEALLTLWASLSRAALARV